MKILILLSFVFMVGCNVKTEGNYVIENQQLKAEVIDLKRQLNIALNINTCYYNGDSNNYYKLGKYKKDKDILADLRVFTLVDHEDAFSNPIKIWQEGYISVEEVQTYYKIPCKNVPKK
ncbi:MAG TPA: hypothetical protein PKI14_01385 [Fervidobacterium sp.]|nr:hypothetical protein [Fervidobacterium sp.]